MFVCVCVCIPALWVTIKAYKVKKLDVNFGRCTPRNLTRVTVNQTWQQCCVLWCDGVTSGHRQVSVLYKHGRAALWDIVTFNYCWTEADPAGLGGRVKEKREWRVKATLSVELKFREKVDYLWKAAVPETRFIDNLCLSLWQLCPETHLLYSNLISGPGSTSVSIFLINSSPLVEG